MGTKKSKKWRKIMLIILVAALLVPVIIWFGFLTSADRKIISSKTHTIEFEGSIRSYRIHLPKNLDNPKLVIGLHGFGDSGLQFAYYTGLHNAVDDNTIVVYPNATKDDAKGYKTGWNSTYCCGAGLFNNVNDEGFLLALIEKIENQYNVNEKQIYMTGFSNGATMSHYMATKHPEVFAAVAPVSGTIGVKEKRLDPKTAVPILLIHGANDKSVPLDGGVTGDDPFFDWLPFNDTKTAWQKANSCDQSGDNCKIPTEVVVHPNLAHKWEGWRIGQIWRTKPSGSKQVVEFFNKNSK